MIVRLRHVLTVPGFSARGGFCRSGARQWFERNGFVWRDFVQHGIDADELLATGDALANAVVNWAKQCDEVAGGQL